MDQQTRSKAVFATASTIALAQSIVGQLTRAGVPADDISILSTEAAAAGAGRAAEYVPQPEPRRSLSDGGLVRFLPGMTSLALAGNTHFIAAGPVAALLARAAEGGVNAVLVGLGVSESQARRYETAVNAGSTLICVCTDDLQQRGRAKGIFEGVGARDICYVNTACWAPAG